MKIILNFRSIARRFLKIESAEGPLMAGAGGLNLGKELRSSSTEDCA